MASELLSQQMTKYIGTAGWAISTPAKSRFTPVGTHLERYAQRLNAVEINSAFYRNHKPETYAKWAASVPEDFRFSVKLLRKFTHQQKLAGPWDDLPQVIGRIASLAHKWGALLVQLPPSLKLDPTLAREFFSALRAMVGPKCIAALIRANS